MLNEKEKLPRESHPGDAVLVSVSENVYKSSLTISCKGVLVTERKVK